MKKKHYTEQQIAFALRQAESGTPVAEIVRRMGTAEATFYPCKQKFDGIGVGEVRRLKQLEDENRKLKQLVADLSLDKSMLQDALKSKPRRPRLGVTWWAGREWLTGPARGGRVKPWRWAGRRCGTCRSSRRRTRCGVGCGSWPRRGRASGTCGYTYSCNAKAGW